MRDLPGERYWMGSSAAAWWETNDIWHKKWEQQASSKCSYKFPGMIHQGTGIFGGNETLQSHTFTKLYRLMSDGFYKRIKGSPCCSSEIFCPPKRCSRLLHRLLICHLPPSLKKDSTYSLCQGRALQGLHQTLNDWKLWWNHSGHQGRERTLWYLRLLKCSSSCLYITVRCSSRILNS